MKLIAEVVERVKPLVEATGDGQKSYMIEGVFLQADLKNRNGRVYPMSILQREVQRYNTEYVAENRALGELGHPDSPHINLDRVSHMIVSLQADGTDFIGRAKIMDTPYGKIVKSFIDEGVKFGVSSRGVGSLKRGPNGEDMVDEDYFLATAADIVADPSAPEAFVQGLREHKEWVWNNGILAPQAAMEATRVLQATPVKTRTQRRGAEVKVFEAYLRSLQKNTRVL